MQRRKDCALVTHCRKPPTAKCADCENLPNEALVIDSPKVDWSAGPEDRRKVTLIMYTTPAELRMIASMLEERSEVRVNWYHTRYSFRNEDTFSEESQ